ncbi:MAG TPA: MFS transporter [Polyangiales bacterium]|nr:MFS transporter [Polyangiales bacterium]
MTTERLPMRTKLGFGVGSIGESAIGIAFATWNVLFYQNVLGLPGKLAAIAGCIALVVDAIFDPVVGSFSDRFRSRLGRRHPFLYLAPIPLGIAFTLVYMPPAGMSHAGLFGWLTIFAILQRQAMTLYQVPHLALGAELSTDYRERSIVMSYNTIFAVVGGAAAYAYGWNCIGKAGGPAVPGGYFTMALGVSVIAALAIFISAYSTQDRIPHMVQPRADAPRFTVIQLLREVRGCFDNYNYRMLLIGLLFLSLTTGTRETLHSYTALFFWELPASKLARFAAASPPAFIIGFFLTVRMHDWLDKRKTMVIAMFILMVGSGVPVLLGLAGLMAPKGSDALVAQLFFFVFTFYLGIAILTITLLSALADIVDEHELKTGLRQEGVFFASRTFFMKMSTAVGLVVGGFVLDAVGFPTGAKPGQVAEEIVNKLAVFEGPMMAVFALVATYFYGRYGIDRARHNEIRRALAERRAHSAPPAAASLPAAPVAPPAPAIG